jgi:hypothetical protein
MTKGVKTILIAMALVLTPAILQLQVHAWEHRRHEAHEHGVAHLNVAVEGSDLIIELFSPAANIVGFEHHPRTQAQKDQVKEARKKLEAAQPLFQLPPQVQGRLIKSTVDTDIDSDSADESGALRAHEPGEGHGKQENPGNDHHQENKDSHEFGYGPPGSFHPTAVQ